VRIRTIKVSTGVSALAMTFLMAVPTAAFAHSSSTVPVGVNHPTGIGQGPASGKHPDVPFGYHEILNYHSDKCLGVAGGVVTDGTKLVQWDCINHWDQWWTFHNVGPWIEIKNYADPSKCMGVGGGSTDAGAALVVWGCNGHFDQKWRFAGVDIGPERIGYQLVNDNSGKVVGVGAASTANGAPIVLWPANGSTDQIWNTTS
jgi:hypothetical protein